jgi:hypothetical protein
LEPGRDQAVLYELGVEGMSLSPLASSIVAGGVFVMGLVIAGTLSDYKDAERSPTDLAAGLYAILRECESMNTVWGKPDLATLRQRLTLIVLTLRADINVGNTRTCQAAIEDLSQSFLELESVVLLPLPAPAAERHRQAVQGTGPPCPHPASDSGSDCDQGLHAEPVVSLIRRGSSVAVTPARPGP